MIRYSCKYRRKQYRSTRRHPAQEYFICQARQLQGEKDIEIDDPDPKCVACRFYVPQEN